MPLRTSLPPSIGVALLLASACLDGGRDLIVGPGGSDGGTDGGPDVEPNELPCEVREAIEALCVHCHSAPPNSGAELALVARVDFLAASPVAGKSVGALSLERVRDAIEPMPPRSEPPPAPAHLEALARWLEAGMPPGTCGAIPPRPAPVTCLSGSTWTEGDTGSALMNPGLACRDCHLRQAPELAYYFAGTVYPGFHEADLCDSPPPEDARIEILDAEGNLTLTLRPNEVGNFSSNGVSAGVPIPYLARLVAGERVRDMVTPQRSGDCNTCHTEQGLNDAPGRLAWP